MGSQAHLDRLEALTGAWNAAGGTWDADALTRLYADDALLFGGRAGHSVGRQEIAGYFQSYVGVIRSATLTLFDQQIVPVGDTALAAQGFGAFAFVLASGQTTRQRMRTTLLLVWPDGPTLIRVHHFSTEPSAPPLGS